MPYKNKEDRKWTKAAQEYESRPDVMERKRKRSKARYYAEKDGKVHKGDGMDIDHITPLSHGGSNAKSNQRVVPQGENRSYDRTPSHAVAKKRKRR